MATDSRAATPQSKQRKEPSKLPFEDLVSYDTMRISRGRFSYRQNANSDWVDLAEAHRFPGKHPFPMNVESCAIDSDGIEILQPAGRYERDEGQKGTSQTSDEYIWKVRFPFEGIKDFHMSEDVTAGNHSAVITMGFTLTAPPVSEDATQMLPQEITGETAAEPEEGELTEEIPDPKNLPLAKFFEKQFGDGLQVRLVFKRGPLRGYWRWIWQAVLWFLSRKGSWALRTKKSAFQSIYNIQLDQWLMVNKHKVGVNVRETKLPAPAGFDWAIKVPATRKDRSSSTPASIAAPASEAVINANPEPSEKRKRDADMEGEEGEDELAKLDREVAGMAITRQNYRDVWQTKRHSAKEAGDTLRRMQETFKLKTEEAEDAHTQYEDADEKLEKLRGRRSEMAGKKPRME